jgi:hypothetical protein
MVPCTVWTRSFQAWASRAGRAVVVQGHKHALKVIIAVLSRFRLQSCHRCSCQWTTVPVPYLLHASWLLLHGSTLLEADALHSTPPRWRRLSVSEDPYPAYIAVPIVLGLGVGKCSLHRACSFDLSATSQEYFSLRTNQPPATSQQYFSLRTNQHQPSATIQAHSFPINWLHDPMATKAASMSWDARRVGHLSHQPVDKSINIQAHTHHTASKRTTNPACP